eukprot:3758230-Prymnesium_polylepis.1
MQAPARPIAACTTHAHAHVHVACTIDKQLTRTRPTSEAIREQFVPCCPSRVRRRSSCVYRAGLLGVVSLVCGDHFLRLCEPF